MNKRRIMLLVLLAISIIIIFVFGGMVKLEKLHYNEIIQVINSQGGSVIEVTKVIKGESPMQTSRSNIIYKIRYIKGEKERIAWYRATKTINDIHSKSKKGLEEKWIFE